MQQLMGLCWIRMAALLVLLAVRALAVAPSAGKAGPATLTAKGGTAAGRRHDMQRMWMVGKYEHHRPIVEALHKMEGTWNHTLPAELLRKWVACARAGRGGSLLQHGHQSPPGFGVEAQWICGPGAPLTCTCRVV
jgi:hypothetical protein